MFSYLRNFCIVAAGLLFAACGSGDSLSEKIEYLPFQSEKDGKWGMISVSGKVLFEEEFDRQPSVVINGRFFVPNSEGLLEMYAADEKPKQVGDVAWKAVCDFTENVTPAVEKGKPITLIDRDGKVVKEMKTIGGKTVQRMRRFQGGRSVYQTAEGYYGMVDTDGEVKIEAKYMQLWDLYDGKTIGIDKKYEEACRTGDVEKLKWTVMDGNGKELSQLSGAKITLGGYFFQDGLLPAAEKHDDKLYLGLLDEKGEWVLKPSSKIESIGEIKGKKFVFYRDGKWGVMDLEGEVLIRAKYDALRFITNDVLLAGDNDKPTDERYQLLNLDGEQIGKDRFRNMVSVMIDGYSPIEISEHDYGFIDEKGELKKLDKGLSIYNIVYGFASYEVESDYVDYDALWSGLDIKADGINGLTLGLSASAAMEKIKALAPGGNYEPESYIWRNNVSYEKALGQVNARCDISFDGYIGERQTRTVYKEYYGYRFPHEETVGYSFSKNAKILNIVVGFPTGSGKLEGKGRDLYLAAAKKVKTLGREVKSNTNAVVVSTGNGRMAVAFYDGLGVVVGIATGKPENVDISQFGDASSGDKSYEVADADSVAVAEDWVAADTVAVE